MSWPHVALKELGKINTGSTPSTANPAFWGASGTPFVTPGELGSSVPITSAERNLTPEGSAAARVAPRDAVLVCCIGSLGKVGIAGSEVVTNQQINWIDFDREVVHPRYGYYACSRLAPQMIKMAPSTTVAILNKSSFSKLHIPLPPLDEQKRIAAILDKADQLRQKRRQAIALLDSLTQSIFLEMFGDPVSNPMGWQTQTVEDFCELIVDCVNRTAPLAERPTDFKMIRTTNVKKGRLLLSEVRYVDEEVFTKWNRRATPQIGDVILTREAPVGEVGILDVPGNFFLGQRLMLYRPDRKKMTSEFMLRSFQSEFLSEQFRQGSSGSTVKHLPLPSCRSFEFRVPPIEIQQQFSKRVALIKRSLGAIEAMTLRMDEVFSSLQHRAFSGQL
ncbi:restriction endonuclease subunit S [Rhizobium leguminosarum]|uniref:restriction endonuclease subunit S n=1 Tax=Rhizobium leguminosarum TaxID=384 RepID=UPI001C9603D5|nr:restriction endonuclease subunit S [Rhizobium leguminosarum]MBY5520222.1 hypothetical protein [Rhizobium leguminosarum]